MTSSYIEKTDFIFYKKNNGTKQKIKRFSGSTYGAEIILGRMYLEELNKRPELKEGYVFQVGGYVVQVKDNSHEVLLYTSDQEFYIDEDHFYFIEDQYEEDFPSVEEVSLSAIEALKKKYS